MRTKYKTKDKTPKRLNSRRALGRVSGHLGEALLRPARIPGLLLGCSDFACSLTFDRDHDEQERPRRRQPPRAQ